MAAGDPDDERLAWVWEVRDKCVRADVPFLFDAYPAGRSPFERTQDAIDETTQMTVWLT